MVKNGKLGGLRVLDGRSWEGFGWENGEGFWVGKRGKGICGKKGRQVMVKGGIKWW